MKTALVVLVTSALLAIAGWSYWTSIGDAKRWLLFNEKTAEAHANLLLAGKTVATPDELLDVEVSTYPGWVLFSPHDDGHALILAYAPQKGPMPLVSNGTVRNWREVKQSWYELEQPIGTIRQ